ncbi:hypothetical protein [Streptomyces ziwulingensis]|uniref:hypothetical protein n=1 Tax=Streptomyces ziwulingensis TaxID=1045501 RepID=UPI0031E58BCB
MSTTASSAQRPARGGVTPRGSYLRPHRAYRYLTSVRHRWSRYAIDGTVIGEMAKLDNPTHTTERREEHRLRPSPQCA